MSATCMAAAYAGLAIIAMHDSASELAMHESYSRNNRFAVYKFVINSNRVVSKIVTSNSPSWQSISPSAASVPYDQLYLTG